MQAIGNFFRYDPQRALYLIRLVIYIVLTLVARQALNPDMLLELIGGVFSLALVDFVGTEANRKGGTTVGALNQVQQISSWGEVGVFAVNLVRGMAKTFVPGVSLERALALVAPIIAPFANQALTPEVQKDIQKKVHETLRAAKLLRTYEFGTVKKSGPLSLLLILALVLAACTPAQDAVGGAVNELGGDSATLTPTPAGLLFDPGDAPTVRTFVRMQGLELQSLDEKDGCIGTSAELLCTLSRVGKPRLVEVRGSGVSATVTYKRSEGGRVYFEAAIGDVVPLTRCPPAAKAVPREGAPCS